MAQTTVDINPGEEDVVVVATEGNDPVASSIVAAPLDGGTPVVAFDPQKHVPIALYQKMQSRHDKLAGEVSGLRTQFDTAVADAVGSLPGDLQKQMAAVQLGMSILHYAKTYNIPADVLQAARTPQDAAEIALAYVSAGQGAQVGEPAEDVLSVTTIVGGGGRQPPPPPVVSPAIGAPQVASGELQKLRDKLGKMDRGDAGYRALWLEVKRQQQLPQRERVGAIL